MTLNSPKHLLQLAMAFEKEGLYEASITNYKLYLLQRPSLRRTLENSVSRCTRRLREGASATSVPLLSVIVPCYNSEVYVDGCIQSIRQQVLDDLEIIVVNDGSTDATLEIISRHASEDNRIIIIDNKIPSGSPGIPRNQAIEIANGKYVGFVDSDDWIDLDYFSTMLRTAEENQCDLVITKGHRNIRNGGAVVEDRIYSHHYFNDPMKTPCSYHPSSMIWDKIYLRHILDEKLIRLGEGKAAVDVIFVLKTYYYFNSISIADTIGYNYRRETVSSVTVNQRKKTNCDFEIQSYLDSFKWADQNKIDSRYVAYMQIKQLSSFIYTCKLISLGHLAKYFDLCAKYVSSYNKEAFRTALVNAKCNYLSYYYDLFCSRDLKQFIEKERTADKLFILESDKHIIPKTLIAKQSESAKGIIFCPDWSYSNPYQKVLYSTLSEIYNVGCYGLEPLELSKYNLELLSKSASILHVHWIHPFTSSTKSRNDFFELIRFAKLTLGFWVVWTVHNHIPHECEDEIFELDTRRSFASMCDRILCHSNAAKNLICSSYNLDQNVVSIMEHGKYDVPITDDECILISKSLSSKRLRLCMMGEMRPYKNIDWAIKFLSEYNGQRELAERVELIVKGKAMSSFQKQQLECLDSTYEWLTFSSDRLSDGDLSRTILASDFVFLPYTQILTSGMAVNAVSHGRPFLAPYSASLDEIGDSSCKVFYNTSEHLEAILSDLVRRKRDLTLNQSFSRSAIASATSRLAWSSILSSHDVKQSLCINSLI